MRLKCLKIGECSLTGHSLITKTNRIIETGCDDASVPLNSSYGSFRSSLNLNVDFCSKNISALGQNKQMKGELVAEQGEKKQGLANSSLICLSGTTLSCGATYWHKMIKEPESDILLRNSSLSKL